MNRNKKRKKTKAKPQRQRRTRPNTPRWKSPKRSRNRTEGRRSRKTPRRSPAARSRKPLQKTSRSPAIDQRASALAKLQSDWTSLPRSERCAELKRLVDQGISKRELARRVKCSQTLIRNLVALADLPEQERQAVEAGTLGRKQALKRSRDRKRMKHLPEPSPADRQRGFGRLSAGTERRGGGLGRHHAVRRLHAAGSHCRKPPEAPPSTSGPALLPSCSLTGPLFRVRSGVQN